MSVAKELGDLIVRLSLDSSKFEDALSRFESQMTKVQKQFQSSATGLTDFDKVTEKLKASADTLTERLGLQKEKVAQLEKAYETSKAAKGEDAEETQRLAQKLVEAKDKVTQTEQALKLVNEQIKLNQNGWYQLGVNLDNVGSRLESVGKKISDVGTSMSMKITAPVMALGTACVKTFTDFDDAMRQVQATMEASDADMVKLTATAKEMGATTPFSASQAAEALNYLAAAGYTADQSIQALPQVLSLASAGGLDLAYASDLVTDNMSALGLEMNQLGTFTDQMAVAAQKSNSNIAQLGEAILTVGGTAKTLSGGVVEMNTVLGILADNGIKGAEGGTALRNMILSLSAPTDVAAKRMKKLGLNVFDANGSMRPMNEIFKDLNGVLGTMSQEKRTEVLSTIFNKVDLKSATALLANCGERFDELSGYIADSDGAAQKMAQTMEGGIGGTFRNLESAVEGLAIAFGERLAPHIKAIADKITELTTKFTNLSPKTQDMIIRLAAMAAAIGPVLFVVGKLTSGVGTFMKIIAPLAKVLSGAQAATGALGTAMATLAGPVLVVIGVVAGLVAIFHTLYTTNEEFKAKMDALWSQITAAFENVRAVFANTFEQLKAAMEPVKESLGSLWQTVQDVFTRLWEFLEPIVTSIGVLIGSLVAVVVSCANGILNAIGPMVDAVVNGLNLIMNLFNSFIALLQGDFAGAWDSLKAAFTSLWTVVQDVFTAIGNFFTGFWGSLCAIAQSFGIDLNAVFSGLWEGIKTTATTAWTNFSTWASETWNSICTTAQTIWNTLTGFFSGLWEDISTAASGAWDGICVTVSKLWNGMTTTASTVWNTVCTNISTAVDTGKAWISTAWENVKTAVTGVWDTVKTTAATAWDTVCNNVKSAVDGAKSGIQTAWSSITTGISSAWDTFKTTASTTWGGITGGVKKAIEDAKSGIVTAWDAIKTGVKDTWDGITAIFKGPIDSASTWLSEKVEWFKNLFHFEWKLPEFKLPKIEVKWNEIGWGISIPSLSLNWNALGAIFQKPTIFNTAAGLQGVGEAGPEAILPLNTLWEEMSQRLKQGMREILREAAFSQSTREDAMIRTMLSALRDEHSNSGKPTSVNVTQNIYAKQTSYVAQQREAARNFRQIARALS